MLNVLITLSNFMPHSNNKKQCLLENLSSIFWTSSDDDADPTANLQFQSVSLRRYQTSQIPQHRFQQSIQELHPKYSPESVP